MGVKELWPILEPVKRLKSFDEMRGETVAIDLSMWIVDSQCVKQMIGTVTRPHLRNLFFRTSALLNAGILPVFVVEGAAPKLKWQTMADRQQTRKGSANHVAGTAKRANRSHFRSIIKECCEMLDYMGVPYIQGTGEAEATCAALNSAELVDAVITEDGDAFLYGAKTVYKNFTTTKTPSVESYSMSDIERTVGLCRSHLIALGILVGCDYCPKGVPGVGKTHALKLCLETTPQTILKRLVLWSTKGLSGDENSIQKVVATKISRHGDTTFPQVINEFMNFDSSVPFSVHRWKKPLISPAQKFNLTKMEWPINYTLEKMLSLVVLWSMRSVCNSQISSTDLSVTPQQVIKKRVRQGVDSLEVLWSVKDPYDIDTEDEKQPSLSTIEPLAILHKCFQSIVEEFQKAKSAKAAGKATKTKSKAKTALSSPLEPEPPVQSFPTRVDPPPPTLTKSAVYSDSNNISYLDSLCMDYSQHSIGGNPSKLCMEARDNQDIEVYNESCIMLDDTNSLQEYSLLAQDHQPDISSPQRRSMLQDISNHGQVSMDCMSPYSLTPDKKGKPDQDNAKENSLDMLLADISLQLKTPKKPVAPSPVTNSDPSLFSADMDISDGDIILTGYTSPIGSNSVSHLSMAGDVELSQDPESQPNKLSLTALGESDMSLFSINETANSLTGSTPLQPVSTSINANQSSTLSLFDIVPQFSLLSFEESSIAD